MINHSNQLNKPTKPAKKRRFDKSAILAGSFAILTLAVLAGLIFYGVKNDYIYIHKSADVTSVPVTSQLPASPSADGPYDVAGLPPLYNRYYPLPKKVYADVADDLKDIGGGERLQTQAADAFLAMQQAAAEDGVELTPVSGYRSADYQTQNFADGVSRNQNGGANASEAVHNTELYYAIPGTSEHEAGLAVDIGFVHESFAGTAGYNWLQQNGTTYGFIYRYPQDGTAVTHIAWEPWHYRFVGANHARHMQALEIATLEEYIAHMSGLSVEALEEQGALVPLPERHG